MVTERFKRTAALVGENGMSELAKSTVMIVGLGAVGGYALEAIARSGVGHLILVDFDRFDYTNINRQILALESTVGLKKTDVAAQRVQEINPSCEVSVKDIRLTPENIDTIFDADVDYVIDAIDSMDAKCALIKTLLDRKIPFVSSMGAALKTDASCIKMAKLSQTTNCSMARRIRKKLKEAGVDITKVNCVFSTEQCVLPPQAITPNPEGGKSILGSLPTITAIFGLTAANFVIKQIVGGTNAENA